MHEDLLDLGGQVALVTGAGQGACLLYTSDAADE